MEKHGVNLRSWRGATRGQIAPQIPGKLLRRHALGHPDLVAPLDLSVKDKRMTKKGEEKRRRRKKKEEGEEVKRKKK